MALMGRETNAIRHIRRDAFIPTNGPIPHVQAGQSREIRRLGAGQGRGAPSSMPRHTRRPRRKAVSGAASGWVFYHALIRLALIREAIRITGRIAASRCVRRQREW